jgi:hypothetical protein
MRFFGLSLADYREDDVLVWPENWRAVQFFIALGRGAWNMGQRGPTGLRPESFREARFTLGVKAAQWPALHADLRVIEQAYLDKIYEDDE